MQKKFPIWVLALIIVLLAVVHGIASYWHLYFYIWWFDIPMHLLGGFWIGLSALVYMYARRDAPAFKDNSKAMTFLLAVTTSFVIGVGWEIFERGVDQMNGLTHFDLVDTLSDVCNDMIGAFAGAVLFLWRGYNKQI